MSQSCGKTEWLIPDCYLPSTSSPGLYVSHESICVLNAGHVDAQIRITLYFEDRPPMTRFTADCPAQRTHHIRLDRLTDAEGNAIPRDVPYAARVSANTPIVVQYSRLDTTQAEIGLATTMAYPVA